MRPHSFYNKTVYVEITLHHGRLILMHVVGLYDDGLTASQDNTSRRIKTLP